MPVYFIYNKLDENDDIDFEMFYGAHVNPSLQNMHRALAGPSGKIAFEVDNDGYYTYCVRQNPPLSRPTVCFKICRFFVIWFSASVFMFSMVVTKSTTQNLLPKRILMSLMLKCEK